MVIEKVKHAAEVFVEKATTGKGRYITGLLPGVGDYLAFRDLKAALFLGGCRIFCLTLYDKNIVAALGGYGKLTAGVEYQMLKDEEQ